MKKTTLTKSLLAFAMFILFASQALGQISTGTPTHRTIPTGNRPVAGDWGIFVGPSFNEIRDMRYYIQHSELGKWYMLPLVNIKYYSSDNFEWRAGIQLGSMSTKTNGTLMNYEYQADKDEIEKTHEAYYRLTPGIAYHFSSNNILDVYVGAQLPFGLNTDNYIYKYDDKNNGTTKRSSFEIGLGAFIGLQCFVADLPVAIGLEYGLSGVKYFGQKEKHTILDQDGNEQTYYTNPVDPQQRPYTKLKSTRGYFGSDLRLTISYFFN